ncbi:DUF411 domain-containing protein [Enterovibrio makurazakiensis]|uniref:DUF411 domain-containing protein n=1 Tax=Enterovibrio gelatinilyticus TaxID=2899819 RepID=A0ABT5R3T4_9GAMM|nr:DUF411 domain-containing protein [Enterovibrio sp. ZSDZ42]MDD1794426.1 DUF411 domain-containing protein [Enterovibrio sp. ZSDZ42]
MKTLPKLAAFSLALLSASTFAATGITYKSPYCGCCKEWVKHMEDNGFEMTAEDHVNMNPIKQKFGIKPQLASCHTTVIDGYVFEGHIPASDVKKFLAEKPKLAGLAVPGMPMGSPGMEYGDEKDAYDVVGFSHVGMTMIYNSHN